MKRLRECLWPNLKGTPAVMFSVFLRLFVFCLFWPCATAALRVRNKLLWAYRILQSHNQHQGNGSCNQRLDCMNKQNKLLLWSVHRLEALWKPTFDGVSHRPLWKPHLFITYYREQVEIHEGIREGACQPLSLTVNGFSAAPVLQKVHLKHTINFPIANVTFYCPMVLGHSELAGSAALLSKAR